MLIRWIVGFTVGIAELAISLFKHPKASTTGGILVICIKGGGYFHREWGYPIGTMCERKADM